MPTSKKFAYCIGGCRSVPSFIDTLTTDRSDCFSLYWKEPGPPGSHFRPATTATSGRNVVFEEAKKGDYEYIIFMDDDVTFAGLSHAEGFRKFESLVDEFHPAIATPRYKWHLGRNGLEQNRDPSARVQGIIALDICLNAVHRSVWQWLLPYWCEFDPDSWWNAAHVFNRVAAVLWPGGSVQFNELTVINNRSDPYPRGGRCRAADKMMNEILLPEAKHLVWPHDSEGSFQSLPPLLKDDYTLTAEHVGQYFDLKHPYFRGRV